MIDLTNTNPNEAVTTQAVEPISKPKQPTQPSNVPGLLIGVIAVSLVTGLIGAGGGVAIGVQLAKKNSSSTEQAKTITQISENIKTVDETNATIDVSTKSLPSVVSIVVNKSQKSISSSGNSLYDLFSQAFGNNNQPSTPDSSNTDPITQIAAGTGFVASDSGYIITNKHVVQENGTSFVAVFNDGISADAVLIGMDAFLDIAILKVDPSSLKTNIVHLPLGDSDTLKVGQTAIAIGNSLGEFSNTVSKGIISGLNRTIVAGDTYGANSETLAGVIQTDASINSGNSGGPLLDINGTVIGVNVAKSAAGESIGFSIPINNVRPILESVVKYGKIVRPYLGVQYTIVTPEIAKTKDLQYDYGAFVAVTNTKLKAVLQDSPAEKAGIKEGDLLLEIENQKITKTLDLRTLIQKAGVGKEISVKLFRDKKEITLKVKLEEYKAPN
jgi:serine protease Do